MCHPRCPIGLWQDWDLSPGSCHCHLEESWDQQQEWSLLLLPGPPPWWLDSAPESLGPLPAISLGQCLVAQMIPTWLFCPLHQRPLSCKEELRGLDYAPGSITPDCGTVCQAAIQRALVSSSVTWGNAVCPAGPVGSPLQQLFVKMLYTS